MSDRTAGLPTLSRDTRVHIVVTVLALALGAAVTGTELVDAAGPAPVALVIAFYALLFGGAHLYLAYRGHDGMIPVDARWRYVAALALVLAGAALAALVPGGSTAGDLVRAVGVGLAVLAALGYLVAEAISGYEATRSE